MNTYEHLIQRGEEQSLGAVAFHHATPFKRFVMLQKDSVTGDGGFRVVTHVISDLPESIPPYCDLHKHDFDEINFIISEDDSLRYKIQLENETYEVGPQTTVYIPAGTLHAAEVISGRGIFVAVMFTKNYIAKQ